ncbi:MAG: glycosyltransferase family 39 protein [Synergistaceae bacterium]|nr:glycosyltransferase family 39 protein [Synergistaceae bacterium]
MTRRKLLYLSGIMLAGLVLYSFRLTYSALWYDESVEYFLSKYLTGKVPGSIGNTTNMYQGICSTYQPPLYNVLMYIWLSFFDSEALFRLAGVLVTLLGAAGLYLGLFELSGLTCAVAGAIVYLTVPKTAYYALECAEYNLMLCCECWTLYFFVKCLTHKDKFSLAGFFVCASLAVYSQYGAVFFAAGLYIVLAACSFRDKVMLRRIAVATITTAIIAVLPLVYFFLVPQVIHQGTTSISHTPVFARGNILYDFARGIWRQAKWMLHVDIKTEWDILGIMHKAARALPVLGGIVAVMAMVFRRDKKCVLLLWGCVVSWVLYWLCVATSIYAYNSWSGSTGFGNRYGLFLLPLWVFTLACASSVFCRTFKRKLVWLGLVICFAGAGAFYVYSGWNKEDVREAAKVWYKENGFNVKTLVHQWYDANFQFYIRHDENYRESFQENIVTAGLWIRAAKRQELHDELKAMGIFEYDKLIYIAPVNEYLEDFKQLAMDLGYQCNSLYEEKSALLFLHKD